MYVLWYMYMILCPQECYLWQQQSLRSLHVPSLWSPVCFLVLDRVLSLQLCLSTLWQWSHGLLCHLHVILGSVDEIIVLKDVLQFTHFLSADFVSMNDCVWASVQYMYMLWTMLSCGCSCAVSGVLEAQAVLPPVWLGRARLWRDCSEPINYCVLIIFKLYDYVPLKIGFWNHF